jgi:hypothetical protein
MAYQPAISMTTIVDFVLASGVPRLTHVRQAIQTYLQDYHPAQDFYRPLRRQIIRVNEDGLPLADLEHVLDVVDHKKHDSYAHCISGYKQFHGKRNPVVWLARPAPVHVDVNGLDIRVNPELMINKGEQPYLIKLYFKEEPLLKKHAELMVSLMQRAYPTEMQQDFMCAVLDLRRGKLRDPFPSQDVDKLLDAEAMAFMQLWEQLAVA